MTQEVISFFDNFKCTANECTSNCCKAWDMPVDEGTMEVYKNEPGFKGKLRRLSIKNNSDGEPVLRTPLGRCCNLSRDGLCGLQLKEREDLMPKVCRLFPRNIAAYGDSYIRGTLDISCIEAAKLFLKTEGRLSFTETERELEVYWNVEDAYPDFVEFLRRDLDRMLDFLWEDDMSMDEFWNRQKGIFIHVYGEHLRLVRGDQEGAENVGFEFADELFSGDMIPRILQEREANEPLPFLPMELINSLIYNKLPDTYLALYHPKMFLLVMSYRKKYGKVLVRNVDRAFKGTWNELCEKYDWLSSKLESYFSYKLQMNYENAAVDFYVLEPVLMAMLNTQFLMIFIMTWCDGKKDFNMDVLAMLISETEKLLSHNTVFCSEAMKEIRAELF